LVIINNINKEEYKIIIIKIMNVLILIINKIIKDYSVRLIITKNQIHLINLII